ncbi:DNA polymerase III subunit beta [Paenibacillus oceani]|uniref:Beta sliding clamp n=1 Tax=Paenibacillus oceani TaxID=2772510 RepID=A0A927CDJ1_9BACL|nr:DNA polymerase III subunit beta [Paenibacillus oceani]MBD2864852.1 DNA polymerase III subunit beta [Paenibacillus oceani]
MKIEVSQAELLHALQQTARAVPPSSPLPILAGMVLRIHREGITLLAGSSPMVIRTDIRIPMPGLPRETEDNGLVVPARTFADIVRKLPPGPVELEQTDRSMLCIRAGSGLFRLCGTDGEEYPAAPEIGRPTLQLRLPNTVLKSMIRQVAFAVSASETRPILTGVWCRSDGEQLKLVATDSVRFASTTSRIEQPSDTPPFEAIVPGRCMAELAKMLQDDQGETRIDADEALIRFHTADMTLSCSLLHGAYPPIDRLVPARPNCELKVDTEKLLQAIERVTLLSGEGCVVFLHTVSAESAALVGQAAEVGDVREEVPIETVAGEGVAISFNGKYMTDILRAIAGGTLMLRFYDKLGPIAAEPEPAAGSSSLYLLTPIRTSR